ncbi:unnamed protein product [Allacma fusca]|uniref:Uncharacterized protein n=1 Tax=Allacma fusca TaxID=39272 RepID=A0A8J2JZN5_9HEXA|nr:unnamed protein product [Allacma fusca]
MSKEDNHRISMAETEPSITFSVASNIKDFWIIFETTLKFHWNCIFSECASNNGRLVLITIWPESVKEDVVGVVIENDIRTNPLLRRFRHAFGMDKNTFIIFPINENLIDTYHAYELYFIKGLLVVERVDSIVLEDMLAFKYRRSNFRKVPIIVASQPDKRFPVQSKYTNVSGHLVLSGGFHYDLLRVLSWTLNFTPFNILGKGWIDKRPDGTLTGMGEQLLKGETDFILSGSEITLYRAEKMSMIHPMLGDRLQIYYKKPTVISLRNIYFSTFMPNVWVAVFIMWLVIGSVFLLFQFFKRKVVAKCETQFEDPAPHWSNTIFWCVCATTQQGNQPGLILHA